MADPARGKHISDADKESLRNKVSQPTVDTTLKLLKQQWNAQPNAGRQPVWAGIKVRDAHGNTEALLVRIDAQGRYSVAKVDNVRRQEAVDKITPTLQAEHAATPGRAVREAVQAAGGTYLVSLSADGTVKVEKTRNVRAGSRTATGRPAVGSPARPSGNSPGDAQSNEDLQPVNAGSPFRMQATYFLKTLDDTPRLVGVTQPTATGNPGEISQPAVQGSEQPKPPPAGDGSELIHTSLSYLGYIPEFGAIANLANAGIYAAESNYKEAGVNTAMALLDLIPEGGQAFGAAIRVEEKIAEKEALGETKAVVEKVEGAAENPATLEKAADPASQPDLSNSMPANPNDLLAPGIE